MTSWLENLPRRAWRRLSAGDGAKGPRLYDWACGPYDGGAPDFQGALLVRRSISQPTEPPFYPTQAPQGTSLAAALLPLTGPEIRYLLWQMVWNHPPRAEAVLHRSDWRRTDAPPISLWRSIFAARYSDWR